MKHAQAILAYLDASLPAMESYLRTLAEFETPTTAPESQAPAQSMLLHSLRELGYDVSIVPGKLSGGHIVAQAVANDQPKQLLVGHTDTVWPIGTLARMPVTVEGRTIKGPGVFDMKAGLTQMIFALRALRALDLQPEVAPVVFINSDEETGSEESETHLRRLAASANRAFVLEPSMGERGRLKTARKGVGRFRVVVHGKAAHAGLEPEKGRSAIQELGFVIQKLFALNEPERGISANVGEVSGGLRANVIAPQSMAVVDVRVPTKYDAEQIAAKIRSMQAETSGTRLEISGEISRMPLERTRRNLVLWEMAQDRALSLGMDLEDGLAGGASDGNITSQFTATLDGLGAVGDGAHADHEFVYLDKMAERSALLAMLLLAPPVDGSF
jgi:glutamate carboxypeptidase